MRLSRPTIIHTEVNVSDEFHRGLKNSPYPAKTEFNFFCYSPSLSFKGTLNGYLKAFKLPALSCAFEIQVTAETLRAPYNNFVILSVDMT